MTKPSETIRRFWGPALLLLAGVGTSLALLLVVGGLWVASTLVTGLLVGTLVALLIALGVSAVRAGSRARKLQEALGDQADREKQGASPDRQAEIDELRRSFDNAIHTLQTSKLGRGRGSALTALPWFLLVGPPGTGKTVAIQQSGLRFPIGSNRIRGVGGTRNCDWFFSDEAIFLDTAGRYMVDHDGTEEWEVFLRAVKTHRPNRPINGVIVAVDILHLLDAPAQDREWHAGRIRRRLDELVEHLGTRFPVYLVITKCDLLRGFVESFEPLSRAERDQPWGFTLSDEDRSRLGRREVELDDVVMHGFDRLMDRLYDHRDRTLVREATASRRDARYVFPVEMAALREDLTAFVAELFRPNPYQEEPLFRGFYFTSGTQEGTPVSPVADRLAADHLPREGESAHRRSSRASEEPVRAVYDPDRKPSSYFLRGLFTDVVVPDQDMAEHTGRRRQRAGIQQAAALVGALLFALLVTALMVRQHRTSTDLLATVESAVQEVDGEPGTIPDLRSLTDLRAGLERLEQRHDDPFWMDWGIDRSRGVLEPARRLYLHDVRSFVRTTSFAAVRRSLGRTIGARAPETPYVPIRLRDRTGNATAAGGSPRDTLRRRAGSPTARSDLRAFLLLTSEIPRLRSEDERAFLVRHLASRSHIDPPAMLSPPDAPREVEQHLRAFTQALADGRTDGFGTDAELVRRVRDAVYEPPSVDRLYADIRRTGTNRLGQRAFRDLVDIQTGSLLQNPLPSIAGIFTKSGYQLVASDALGPDGPPRVHADWVLGHRSEDLPVLLQDPGRTREALRDRYFSEYATAWEQFLQSVQVRPFRSVRDAARSLQELGDPFRSPLTALLATAAAETRFDESGEHEAVDAARAVAADAVSRRARRSPAASLDVDTAAKPPEVVHPVERRFRWLHALRADDALRGRAPGPALEEVLAAYRRLGATLDARVETPDDLVGYAAHVLDPEAVTELEEARATVRRAFTGMDPSVRRALFEAPLREAWRQVIGVAQRHLDRRWDRDVCRLYREGIADRYPMNPETSVDASLQVFHQFFHPQDGAVSRFENEILDPFLDRRTGRPRTWEGIGVRVSPETQDGFRRADAIARDLFSGDALGMTFALQPDHPERTADAPPVSHIYVEIHGREAGYDMGSYRPWTSFAWPNIPGAVVRVRTQNGEQSPIRVDGDWAWWRLLQQASVQRHSATTYRVRWPLEDGLILRYQLRLPEDGGTWTDPTDRFRFTCSPALG